MAIKVPNSHLYGKKNTDFGVFVLFYICPPFYLLYILLNIVINGTLKEMKERMGSFTNEAVRKERIRECGYLHGSVWFPPKGFATASCYIQA